MAGAYFGDPGQGDSTGLSDILPLFHAIRNRNLQDYQAKKQIDSDMAIRQENSRRVFDPTTGTGRTTNPDISYGLTAPNPQIATTLKEDLSPIDKANLQLKKNEQTIEQGKIAQTGKIGEERLGIQQQQSDINRQKNENIHQIKEDDLQRKVNESNTKLGLAYDQLQQKSNDNTAHINFLKAKDEADQARHQLELAQKDAAQKSSDALNQAKIDDLHKKYQDSVKSIGYQYDPESGKLIKQTEQSGRVPTDKNPAFKSVTTYKMIDKDGKPWMVSDENKAAAIKAGMTEAKQ